MIVEKHSPVPVPEQSVFDTRVFSEKKTPNNKPKCPSPPLKTPPVSRIFNQPLYTPIAKPISTPGSIFLTTPEQKLFTTPSASGSFFDEHFENLGEIGAGSFGHVYKVRSKTDKCTYAIKRSRHQFRGAKDRQRALAEVWFAAQLPSHPHVLRYVNAWEEQGYLFIQTELCEKGSLKDYLEVNAPLQEEVIWGFLLDMVLGMQHIHAHNLLHLDVKPANLFFSSDGHLKIGDFGLVHQLDDSAYDIEGDSRYMALELLSEDTSKVSLPADIFCIGATCFEMVVNVEMPANGTAWSELRHGNASVFLAHTRASDSLKSLIQHMMAPDPDQRPTALDLLDHSKLRETMQRRSYSHDAKGSLLLKTKQSSVESLPQLLPPNTPPSAPAPFGAFTSPSIPFAVDSPISSVSNNSFEEEDDEDFLLSHNQLSGSFVQEREQLRRESLESYGMKTGLEVNQEVPGLTAIAPKNLLDMFDDAEDEMMDG